jgi:hypothetical protein
MSYNPEHDALILREHARLREELLQLTHFYTGDRTLVSLADVLKLLQLGEADGAVPQRSPRRIRID